MTWGDAGTAITAMGKAAAATVAFRVGGELRVAVVVKATFVLAPDGPMALVDPDPIVRADQLRDKSPTSSLAAAGELVPYRPHADVLLQGHARAPHGNATPAMAVRLMVARGSDVVLDKRLAVRGTPDPAGATREPSPFAAMLLTWELAAGTPDNPVGIRETAHAWPHIVDPRQRDRAAGFGPLSPRWPPRQRLLKVGEGAFAARIPEFPRDFAWSYFNAAPEDQRVEFFRGDEWVGFEGMNSQLPRVQSYLPGAVAKARVYGPQGPSLTGQPVPLEADTVIIDTDRLRCSVVWRGSFPMRHEKYLPVLEVVAGVEVAGEPLVFPATYTGKPGAAPMPAAAPAAAAPQRNALLEPRTQEIPALGVAPATPFGPSSSPPRPIPARPLPAATPFEGARLAPAPAPGDRARVAAAKGRPEDQTLPLDDDDGLLGELEGTLPMQASVIPRSASALPFGRPSPASSSSSATAPPAPAPGAPAFDAGSTVDFGALLAAAGAALPFGAAAVQPAPAAAPSPQARKGFDAGGTMLVPAFVSGDALPFAGATPPAREAPPLPVALPSPPSSPGKFNAGATVALDLVALGAALPFAGAAAASPSPPPVVAAPAVVPAYAPMPATPATFAPVPTTFAPVAPASPPLMEALRPLPEPQEGEAPKTLGGFFLAAMARAARNELPPGLERTAPPQR